MAWTERYVRADADSSGDGTTDANSGANGSFTLAQMLADTTSGSVRYNVKVGTYSRTTSADTFTTAGTASAPRAIRGFNSTIGDLEANGRTRGGALVTTNFPVITYTTGNITFPANMIVEAISVTSARFGATATAGSSGDIFRRCKFANTQSIASNAVCLSASSAIITDCDFAISSSDAGARCISTAGSLDVTDSLFTGGGSGSGVITGTGSTAFTRCMMRDLGYGVSYTGIFSAHRCSLRNIAGNYFNNLSGPLFILNCVAWGSGGSSKFYNSTTSVRPLLKINNFVGNMGSSDTNEGDWLMYTETALTADPFTSSTDLTLNATAGGGAAVKAAGYPAYLDGGAWQSQASGGGIVVPAMLFGSEGLRIG